MGWKNEAGLSYTLPCLSVAVTTLSFSIYDLHVFPSCPAEMLPTLRLKTGRLIVLTGSVQIRSVMFKTGLYAFKYGQLV